MVRNRLIATLVAASMALNGVWSICATMSKYLHHSLSSTTASTGKTLTTLDSQMCNLALQSTTCDDKKLNQKC
eukprot:scaffold6577_cov175-Amphora_coffeaeformis.AAC.3